MRASAEFSDKIVIRKLAINDNFSFYFLCLFFFFPFFEPRIFFNYAPFKIIDKVYMVLELVCFCLLAMRYIFRGKISKGFLCLTMYRVSVLACTLYSARTIDTGWVSKTLIFLGTMMALELYIQKDALKTLKCLYLVLMIPLIINFVMCLLGVRVPGEGTHYYFIGMRTQFPNTMIPAILLSMMISYMEKKTIRSPSVILTVLICTFQLLKEWVGTGLVLIVLLIGMIYYFINKPKQFHAPLFFLVTLVLNYSIAVLRIQDIFSFIIVDIMHKDLTLTGRTSIWDVVIKKISQNPWFGYGEIGNGGIVKVFWADRLVPAHNSMLQIVYDGGLISFAFLLIFIFYACTKLKKYNDSKLSCIIGIGAILTGVQMFTEVLQYQLYFYLFFMLACNIHHIVKNKYSFIDR